MDRRFLMVLGVSLLFALVVSSIFYQMQARAGGRSAEPTDTKDIVVATRQMPIGVNVKAADVKVQKVAVAAFPKGAFSNVNEVLDRPVVSPILMDEPLIEGRLAARGSGMGLAPIIPVGMRAVSVRVSDVSGVTGFVLPNMHVDVLVTGRPPSADGSITNTCLQNILVLSAGTNIQPDARGQAISAQTVTLLVTPEQAEILTLAGNEGKIQLVLRNNRDETIEKTFGKDIGELYGRGRWNRRSAASGGEEGAPKPRPKPRPVAVVVAPPPPPPAPPPPPEVVVIRGNTKTVEVVGAARQNN